MFLCNVRIIVYETEIKPKPCTNFLFPLRVLHSPSIVTFSTLSCEQYKVPSHANTTRYLVMPTIQGTSSCQHYKVPRHANNTRYLVMPTLQGPSHANTTSYLVMPTIQGT
jgi:hypothetical protein